MSQPVIFSHVHFVYRRRNLSMTVSVSNWFFTAWCSSEHGYAKSYVSVWRWCTIII